MKFTKLASILLSVVILATGCTAMNHRQQVQDNTVGNNLTVGIVQKEIRIGMSAADVATVMGTPNIVTTDENRNEVWIYDKVATDHAYSKSSGGISALFLGFGSNAGGVGGTGYNADSGASSTSQRTLTVVIKFDKQNKVRDFSYHTSKF